MPPPNKSLERSGDSVLVMLFCPFKVVCLRAARSTPAFGGYAEDDERQEPHGAVERSVASIKRIAPCSTLRALECDSFLRKVVKRKRHGTSEGPPNKRLHLTANSAALKRKTWMVSRLNARQVKRGVRHLLFSYEHCLLNISSCRGAKIDETCSCNLDLNALGVTLC